MKELSRKLSMSPTTLYNMKCSNKVKWFYVFGRDKDLHTSYLMYEAEVNQILTAMRCLYHTFEKPKDFGRYIKPFYSYADESSLAFQVSASIFRFRTPLSYRLRTLKKYKEILGYESKD